MATTNDRAFPRAGSWLVSRPTGAVTIKVGQCFGGGAGGQWGSSGSPDTFPWGGGGGAFAQVLDYVWPNQPGYSQLQVTVGRGGAGGSGVVANANGEVSLMQFIGVGSPLCKADNGYANTNGGAVAGSVGDTRLKGGNGGLGTTLESGRIGGGGGGAGGTTGEGRNGVNQAAGTRRRYAGGSGGAGSSQPATINPAINAGTLPGFGTPSDYGPWGGGGGGLANDNVNLRAGNGDRGHAFLTIQQESVGAFRVIPSPSGNILDLPGKD